MGQVLRNSDCPQHIRWLQGLTRAGRARADCILFQSHQQAFSLDACERQVEVTHVSLHLISIQVAMDDTLSYSLQYFVIQFLNVRLIIFHLFLCNLASFTKTNCQSRSQSPRSESSFLSSSVYEGQDSNSWLSSKIQSTNSLGSIYFVPTYAQKINIHLVHIDGDLPSCLGCVSMEENSSFPANFTDFAHGLHHSDFIVHENSAYAQNLFLGLIYCFLEQVKIEYAIVFQRQVSNLETLELQVPACVEYALVLNLGGYDVLSLLAVEGGQSLQDHVVGLGGPGSKDDFARVSVDEIGDLLACSFHSLGPVPSVLVSFRVRVAVVLQHVGSHRIHYSIVDRGRGLVVQVDHAAGREGLPNQGGPIQ